MGRRENTTQKSEEGKKHDEDHSAVLSAISEAKQELAQLGRDKAAIVSSISQLESDRKIAVGLNKAIEDDRRTVSNKYFAEKRDFEAFVAEHIEKKASMTASLPDVDAALAELEAKKVPIRSEIDRLSKLQLEAQESLKVWQDKVSTAEENVRTLTAEIEELERKHGALNTWIEHSQDQVKALEVKKAEHDSIVAGIETRGGILADTNKKITEAENRLITTNSDVEAARAELVKVEEEKKKVIEDADARMKTLATLEARVDGKIEVFKQYKEKFTVDELARMKIDTKVP